MGELGLITAGAAILAVGAEAAAAAGLSPAGLSGYLLSNAAGIGRLAVVVLVLVASWTSLRWPKAAAVPAALALGAVAVSGHAGSAIPRLAAVAIDWAHLLAAAIWVGGIAVIALAWGPELRHGGVRGRLAVAREVLPVFGLIALPAFLLVAMTGLLSAVIQLGEPSALWMTVYGRVLALKLALVVVLAAASYMHAIRDSATTLRVAVGAGSDRGVATLPARWKPDPNRRARRILERAQSTMRELRSFRETERATSGLGRVGSSSTASAPEPDGVCDRRRRGECHDRPAQLDEGAWAGLAGSDRGAGVSKPHVLSLDSVRAGGTTAEGSHGRRAAHG